MCHCGCCSWLLYVCAGVGDSDRVDGDVAFGVGQDYAVGADAADGAFVSVVFSTLVCVSKYVR